MNFGFLKPKQRQTPPGLCLLTDAASSEAVLREWQQELLKRIAPAATAAEPDVRPRGGERA